MLLASVLLFTIAPSKAEQHYQTHYNIYEGHEVEPRSLLDDPGGGKITRWSKLALESPIKRPRDYGVYHAELTGPLTVANGSTVLAVAVMYYKAVKLRHRLALRAQVHILDAVRDPLLPSNYTGSDGKTYSFHFPYHEQPAWLTQLVERPQIYLIPARYGKAVLDSTDAASKPITLQQQHIGALDPYLTKPADKTAGWNSTQAPVTTVLYESKWLSTLPYLVNVTLPPHEQLVKDGITDFYLSFGNFSQRALISYNAIWSNAPIWAGSQKWGPPEAGPLQGDLPMLPGPLTFVSVMQPFYHGPVDVSVTLLEVHIAFHQMIGINKTMVYERGSFLGIFQEHPELSKSLMLGDLELMMWEHGNGAPAISAAEDQMRVYAEGGLLFDQDFLYNHAVLCHWGRNTYLYFTDSDDFIMLRPGQMVQQIIDPTVALCGISHAGASYLQFSRWNFKCAEDAPALTDAAGLHSLAIRNRKKRRRIRGVPQTDLRLESFEGPLEGPLINFTLRHMHCYWKNKGNDKPKIIVHADAAAYVDIHYAILLDHAVDAARWVPEDCGGIAHLYDLRGNRKWDPAAEVELSKDWLWPLHQLQQAPESAVRDQD